MHRVVLPDGRHWRLTVREGARLQSFPDWFAFQGKEKSQFNQIGNAVPPMLAYAIADEVRRYLESPVRFSQSEIRQRKNPQQLECEVRSQGFASLTFREGLHNSLANPDDVNAIGDVEHA